MGIQTPDTSIGDRLEHGALTIRLDGTSVYLLEGADARGWLQGQVSQDLRDMPIGATCDACLLQATGHIDAVLRLWNVPEGMLVATEAPAPLLDRIHRFVILEDVRADGPPFSVLSVQGSKATDSLATLVGSATTDAVSGILAGVTVWALRSPRSSFGGWDIAVPAECIDAAVEALGLGEAASASVLAVDQLEHGVPRVGVDITGRVLPPELGKLFLESHVSYKKGCYSGQEVLARIHSRGHTNRTWVGLRANSKVDAGDVLRSVGGVEVGTVLQCLKSPYAGWIASAFVKNASASPGTRLLSPNGELTVNSWPIVPAP